jgi:hypothetical protein
LSLLLCLATAVLWVQSYWFDSSISLTGGSYQLCIRFVRGHIGVGLFQPVDGFAKDEEGVSVTSFTLDGESDLEWVISDEPNGHKWSVGRGGFYFAKEHVSMDLQRWLVLPAWSVLAPLAVAAVVSARRSSRTGGRGFVPVVG